MASSTLRRRIPEPLTQGATVSLHSLSAAEMNGLQGVLISWDTERERWSVHVRSLGRTVALKPANLRAVERATTENGSATITNAGPNTVAIGPGHLGVTLANHSLGVKIERAHPPDSIAQAGLRCGDVISAVDGIRVTEHAEAVALLGSDITKPIILHEGLQPTHTVEYYTAAEASNILYERSVVGRLSNAWKHVTESSAPAEPLKDDTQTESATERPPTVPEAQPTASEGRPPACPAAASSHKAGLSFWLLLGVALIVLWQMLSPNLDAILDRLGL